MWQLQPASQWLMSHILLAIRLRSFIKKKHMPRHSVSPWCGQLVLTDTTTRFIIFKDFFNIIDFKYILIREKILMWIGRNRVPNYMHLTWWRHQMETFSALQAICAGIHRSPVNFPHKGQWRGALMFSLIYAWINGWVNTGEIGNFRRHRTNYDVIVMMHSKYTGSRNSVAKIEQK